MWILRTAQPRNLTASTTTPGFARHVDRNQVHRDQVKGPKMKKNDTTAMTVSLPVRKTEATSNAVALSNNVRWEVQAAAISATWQKSVAAVFETGRLLVEAKDTLEHGTFESMVNLKLPFGRRTAERLMAIVDHPVISKATHASLLPSSWMTLYELTKVEPEALREAFEDGTINPKMERSDVIELRGMTKPRKSKFPKSKTDPYARCISMTSSNVEEAIDFLFRMRDSTEERAQLFLGLRTLLDNLERHTDARAARMALQDAKPEAAA
jgi:hypothetical protein